MKKQVGSSFANMVGYKFDREKWGRKVKEKEKESGPRERTGGEQL